MYIGLDVGGYKINGVLMQGNKIVKKRWALNKSTSNRKIIIAQIFDCIEELISGIDSPRFGEAGKKEIKGIGIGVPGPIDFRKQKILNPPNVTGLKNLFLAKIVREKFKIKTKIENDANCFGLAEALLGAGKSKKIVAGLTLGTGVGGFLVVNKKIFRGKLLRATEFGHIAIISGGRKCSCGRSGCLEAYISARGIMKTAQEIGLKKVSSPEEITQMARRGDKKAVEVYQKTGEYLGIGLANIVNILNPDIIVIGGGIANAGKFIFEPARKIMKENILSPLAKNTRLVKAKFGENAGAIGAALLVKFYPQFIHNKG